MSSAHRIVVLGGGTGGTLTANRLRRRFLSDEATITVVDRDDEHVYQPGLLFVPFGLARPEDIVRPRARQLHDGIDFRRTDVERVETARDVVVLAGGEELPYDVLVVATGARLQPEQTEGLLGPAWNRSVFTFYDLPGAVALRDALARFEGGHLVVAVMDMPIKCPVAPLELCFLADWFFTERGIRDKVRITHVTPLDSVFTRPVAAKRLGDLLARRDIEVVADFTTATVDGEGGQLVSYDERNVPFDLAVVVPLHGGAEFMDRSPGLGDALGFVETDPHTLQTRVKPNIFAIGDAAGVPTSKAGSVTHFEAETVVENVVRHLEGRPLDASYDGHANCFIETGFGKAIMIDFNYETEPLPGRFPNAMGLPLLEESRLAHLGKLLFQWMYWHVLLPGRRMPGIPAHMPVAGKQTPAA